MAKIKFDVSGSDPDKALAGGEAPKPGVYSAVLVSCEPGFKKSDDGTPDKSAPRIEPIVRIDHKGAKSPEGSDANGALLYDYIGFTEAQEWKLDQFLQAFGIATSKKRKGTLDTDALKNKPCKVRVKADTYNGAYSAKVGAWLPAGEGDSSEDDDTDVDLEEEADTDSEEETEDDPFAEDSEDGDEDGAKLYTREELEALSPTVIAKIAIDEFDFKAGDMPGKGKAKLKAAIDKILEMQDEDPFA